MKEDLQNQVFTNAVIEFAKGLDYGKRKRFAKKVGISEVQAGKILRGQVPKWNTLVKIAKAYNKSVDWLLTGEETIRPFYTANLEIVTLKEAVQRRLEAGARIDEFVPAPLYKDTAALGTGRKIDEREVEDYILLSARNVRKGARLACIRATGESMLPTLREGDIVCVDLDFREPRRLHKKLICANLAGDGEEAEVTIKELRVRKGKFYLRAHNQEWEAEEGHIEIDPREGIILGKVISLWRKFE